MHRIALAVAVIALVLVAPQPPRALAEAPLGGRDTPFSLPPGIYVLDLAQGETRRLASTEDSSALLSINRTLAWSPDGARLATLPSIGKSIQVYEAASGRLQRDIPGQVYSIDWPFAEVIGATMPSGAEPGSEQGRGLIDVGTGRVGGFLPGISYPAAVSPDGRSVAYLRHGRADEQGLYWRDVDGGGERRLLAGQPFGISWSPDSTRIATSTYTDGGSSSILILDAKSGQERARIAGWAAVVTWSPDGAWLAAAASEKSPQESDHTELSAHVHASDGSSSRRVGTGTPGSWSPDSKSLALVRDGQIWLYSMTDGQVTPLLRPQMPVIQEISWSPNGRMIAFSTGGASGGIYVAKPDGSEERYVVPGFGPKWSPKGDRLGLMYGQGGLGFAGAVYTVTPQGTAINQLGRVWQGDVPSACTFGVGFAWSTDGSSIAVWTRGTNSGLRLNITADSPTPQRRDSGAGSAAAWSPDGSRIAYTEPSPTLEGLPRSLFACRVSVSDPDGANSIPLTDGARGPVWSPDGRWLAVEVINGPHGFADATRIVASDGGGKRAEVRGRSPAWSPDGSRLAVIRPDTLAGSPPRPHAPSQLVVSNPDGSNERVVVTDSIGVFDWSPDGTRIVYAVSTPMDTSIHIIDLETGVSKRLAKGSSPSWSPDGQWIAFQR